MSQTGEDTEVCDKCEAEYRANKHECPSCGSSMTRRDFVIESSYAREAPPFFVQVSEGFGDDDPNRLQITMMKPGGPGEEASWPTVSFTNPEIFQATLSSIEEVYDDTQWDERADLLEELSEDHEDRETVRQLLNQFPSFFNQVLDTVDFEQMGERDISILIEAIDDLNSTVLEAEEQIQESFLSLLDSLTDEDEQAYEELANLFDEWHALQITSTSNVLMRRLRFLNTFEDMILNDDVYEIGGEPSIHRSLENNLWLLNEDYWLMQSNRSLRRFVQKEMEQEVAPEDEDEGSRRPDFVCATQGNHLVVAEIKRPSHTLTEEDLGQLQDYM